MVGATHGIATALDATDQKEIQAGPLYRRQAGDGINPGVKMNLASPIAGACMSKRAV
jgi:hypothetical protein